MIGVRPGSPLQYRVPAAGGGDLDYSAQGLPPAVRIDPVTGIITGRIVTPGNYDVTLTVSGKYGMDRRRLMIKVGPEICLTPPMGWNSWYAHSDSVSETTVRAAAHAMVDRGLAAHGWSYINIDDCWQGVRAGRDKALQPNDKFSDMKRLCDDVHALGLKLGIYSTPWMGTYAGFIGGSAPNEQADYSSLALPDAQRGQPFQFFGGYPAITTNGLDTVGPVWLFDRDVAQWAEWGIDFVKVDWNPNDPATARRIAADLRAADRDIVYSISNSAALQDAQELSTIANLWRTTGDIFDNWESISGIATAQIPWQRFGSPGHWNDPDMLQVGALGITNGADGRFYPTKLTHDEQIFQVSLWCLLSAPLFISCDLASLDDFTLWLLTNDEVIAIDQDPAGLPACHISQTDGDIWIKRLWDGSMAVGLFNRGAAAREMEISWDLLGCDGPHAVRDLWARENHGESHRAVRCACRAFPRRRSASRFDDLRGTRASAVEWVQYDPHGRRKHGDSSPNNQAPDRHRSILPEKP